MLKRVAIGLMLALLVSGCGTMKAYEGPELPKSEIAILHRIDSHGKTLVLLLVVPLPGVKHTTEVAEIDGAAALLADAVAYAKTDESRRLSRGLPTTGLPLAGGHGSALRPHRCCPAGLT